MNCARDIQSCTNIAREYGTDLIILLIKTTLGFYIYLRKVNLFLYFYLSIPFKIDSHDLPVIIQAKRPYKSPSIPKLFVCCLIALRSLFNILSHKLAYSTITSLSKFYSKNMYINTHFRCFLETKI